MKSFEPDTESQVGLKAIHEGQLIDKDRQEIRNKPGMSHFVEGEQRLYTEARIGTL